MQFVNRIHNEGPKRADSGQRDAGTEEGGKTFVTNLKHQKKSKKFEILRMSFNMSLAYVSYL